MRNDLCLKSFTEMHQVVAFKLPQSLSGIASTTTGGGLLSASCRAKTFRVRAPIKLATRVERDKTPPMFFYICQMCGLFPPDLL